VAVFHSQRTPILTLLAAKQSMYIEVRLHTCGDSSSRNVNSRCWFVLRWLYKPYWRRFYCPEKGTSPIDCAQLTRYHKKTETKSNHRNVVF
jgi:hypothetical protein